MRLAEVLRLELIDQGESVSDLDELVLDVRTELRSRCSQLNGLVETGLLSLIIDADQAEIHRADLSNANDALEKLAPLDDLSLINSHLDDLEKELRSLTYATREKLKERYDEKLARIISDRGAESVAALWQQRIEEALGQDNLPVSQEMLDELRTGMTKRQVHFVLGTPIAKNIFSHDYESYIYTYLPAEGEATKQVINVYYQNGQYTHHEGQPIEDHPAY